MPLHILLPGAKPQGSKTAYVVNGRAVLVEASKDLKKHRQITSQAIAVSATRQGWIRREAQEPVSIDIAFTIQRPKTVQRDKPAVKPDLDKLIRFVLDAITQAGNVWQDDAQVCKIVAVKKYGETNETEILIHDQSDS